MLHSQLCSSRRGHTVESHSIVGNKFQLGTTPQEETLGQEESVGDDV